MHFQGKAIPDSNVVTPGASISVEITRTNSAEDIPLNQGVWTIEHAADGQTFRKLNNVGLTAISETNISHDSLYGPSFGLKLRDSVTGSVKFTFKGSSDGELKGFTFAHEFKIAGEASADPIDARLTKIEELLTKILGLLA